MGERYRCLDCPETIGFDLCAACCDLTPAEGAVGRFNQHHTAEHTLERVRPRLTSLHLLKVRPAPDCGLLLVLLLSAAAVNRKPRGGCNKRGALTAHPCKELII